MEKAQETACTLPHHMNCYNPAEAATSLNTDALPAIQDQNAQEGVDRIAKVLNAGR